GTGQPDLLALLLRLPPASEPLLVPVRLPDGLLSARHRPLRRHADRRARLRAPAALDARAALVDVRPADAADRDRRRDGPLRPARQHAAAAHADRRALRPGDGLVRLSSDGSRAGAAWEPA